MKTKLMVLALMAGGSMFAASRVSFGVSVGAVDPYCAPQAYNSYTYVAPRYDNRYDNGYRDRDRRVVVRDHDRDDRGRVQNASRGYSNDFHRR
jgi:hypothetical protein